MLDLHSVYDATGSTDTVVAENNTNAVIPANDGATTIGVSPFNGAVLIGYGATVVATTQALTTIGLSGNNLVDPTNKSLFSLNTTPLSTSILAVRLGQYGYGNGPNLVNYANEAAGKTATFKIDHVGVGSTVAGTRMPVRPQSYTVIAGGAATAGVYQTTAFAPTNTPPIGTYAILGANVTALTTAAVLRFQHTDFAGAYPGFPVTDLTVGALTPGNIGASIFTDPRNIGYQFVAMSELTGKAACPVFRVQGQGTGLNLQLLDTAADTAQIELNLLKVG